MEGRPRVNHPLSSYIEVCKDSKTGSAKTVLKIPYWARQESQPPLEYHSEDSGTGPMSGSTGSASSSPSSSSPSLRGAPISYESSGSGKIQPVSRVTAASLSSVRGRADGGFTDLHNSDFTTAALEGITYARGTADGSGGSGGDNDNDGDSDFDDFSDEGNEHVNIIEVVNRLPSPVPPPPPPPLESPPPVSPTSPARLVCENLDLANHNTGASGAEEMSQDKEIDEIYFHQERPQPSIGQCRAIYDYSANMYDELSIKVGDMINIHDKQADGWWLGELNGTVGIFPATYVEEEDGRR